MNTLDIRRSEHNQENPFVMVSLAAARDSRLSFTARGLLTYILSHSNGWKITTGELKTHGLGRDAALAVLNELERHGYLERVENERQAGQFTPDTWVIREAPHIVDPCPESSDRKPSTGNPLLVATRNQYINKKNHQPYISSENHHQIVLTEVKVTPGETDDDDDFYLNCLDGYKSRFGDPPNWVLVRLRRQIKRLGTNRVSDRLSELQPKENPWAYAISVLENMPTIEAKPPPPTPSPVSTIRSWARESLNDVPEWFAPNLEVMT